MRQALSLPSSHPAASLADSHIILESMFEDSFYKAAQHASRFSLHPGTEETQHLPPVSVASQRSGGR